MKASGPLAKPGVIPVAKCQFIPGSVTADDACKCGSLTLPGSVYCADHYSLCYVAGIEDHPE